MRGFRPPQELDDKITAIAESKKKSYSDTLIELLKSATSGEDPNRYEWLEKACPGLVHANDGFYCFIKAPTKHQLGDGSNEDARKFCKSCQAIKGVLDKAELTDRLLKSGYQVDIPYCMNTGGKIRENLKTVWCPKVGTERPIEACEKAGSYERRCEFFRIIKADARLTKTSPKE